MRSPIMIGLLGRLAPLVETWPVTGIDMASRAFIRAPPPAGWLLCLTQESIPASDRFGPLRLGMMADLMMNLVISMITGPVTRFPAAPIASAALLWIHTRLSGEWNMLRIVFATSLGQIGRASCRER